MRQILFPKWEPETSQPSFMGRNGYYHEKGVQVRAMACGLIAIQPITMKGKTGRCTIEIPPDAEVIADLIVALQEAFKEAKQP